MQSRDWLFKKLEVELIPMNDKETITDWQSRCAIINLTNHSLYSKLCYWRDFEFIFNLRFWSYKTAGNYIPRLYYLCNAYKTALTTRHHKIYYNHVKLCYNNLIKMKTQQIDIYLLLNSFIGLDTDIISIIKHYNTLLFL